MIIDGVKFSCTPCLRGHRSANCPHGDRPLTEVKKKGRPPLQCPTCSQRKRKGGSHAKCLCPGYGGSLEINKERVEKKRRARKPPVETTATDAPDVQEAVIRGEATADADLSFEHILTETIAELPSPTRRSFLQIAPSFAPFPVSYTTYDSSSSEHEPELDETRYSSLASSISDSPPELPFNAVSDAALLANSSALAVPMMMESQTQKIFELPPLDPESKVTTWMDDLSTLSAALPFAPTYDLSDFAAGDTITCYDNCVGTQAAYGFDDEEGRDVRSMAFWASMGGASGNGSLLELPTMREVSSSDEWESCDDSSASGYASTSVSESECGHAWERMPMPGPGEGPASGSTSASASTSGSESGWPITDPREAGEWRY